jgi:hypothetical protein
LLPNFVFERKYFNYTFCDNLQILRNFYGHENFVYINKQSRVFVALHFNSTPTLCDCRDFEEMGSLDESIDQLERSSLASYGSGGTTDSDNRPDKVGGEQQNM